MRLLQVLPLSFMVRRFSEKRYVPLASPALRQMGDVAFLRALGLPHHHSSN